MADQYVPQHLQIQYPHLPPAQQIAQGVYDAQGPPPQNYARAPAGPALNKIAVLALVCGLTFAPLGIIFGIIGRRQTDRTGENGHGMATAGLILGIVGLVIPLVLLIAMGSMGS